MSLTGNATTESGNAVDFVRVFSWPDNETVSVIQPNPDGSWTFDTLVPGEFGLTYIANGCQPITHGPYFAEPVALLASLLHFDGANGSTTISDVAGGNWVAHSGAKLDTGTKKFGSASLSVVASGAHISRPASPEFNFGGKNFTIELFVTPATTQGGIQGLFGQMFGSYRAPVRLEINANRYNFLISDASGNWVAGTGSINAPISGEGITDHVALVRNGDNFTLYVNGISKGSRTYNDELNSASTDIMLGTIGGPYDFNGHIDEFRVVVGRAVYTDNFTPPAAPFSDTEFPLP